MQLKNIFALLVAASAVQASMDIDIDYSALDFDQIEERDMTLEERANGCVRGVHIIAAGGEGTTKGDLGYLQSTVTAIRRAVPNSNVHQVPYPPGASPGDSIGYAYPRMMAHVKRYAKRCPRSKMALVGYSVGGAVVMDTLCGDPNTGKGRIPRHLHRNVVATIVYGDPTFVAGLKYDKGSCDGSQGPSDVPRQFPGHCHPFGRRLRSFCDYNDPECCNGSDPNVHFGYPGKYDGRSANWVRNHWRRSRKNN